MFESASAELNALASIEPKELDPYEFGRHILFLVWMGLYERALEQLAQASDEQLFTTASIRAYQFAVTFMYRKPPIADFEAVCDRYRLLPNPVSRMMHCPLLHPSAPVIAGLASTPVVIAAQETAALVSCVDCQKSFTSSSGIKAFSELISQLKEVEDTVADADLCTILLAFGQRKSAEVERLCWHALEIRPNSCQLQQALPMVLEQLGRREEAAMESTRFATLYPARSRAIWVANRYRAKAEMEPFQPESGEATPKGQVKNLIHLRRISDRLNRAPDEGRVQPFRDSPVGKLAWGSRLESEIQDALSVDKVDLGAQPSPSSVIGQANTADAREFGRLVLYLAWGGHYRYVAELCESTRDGYILQASVLHAIRLSAAAVCSDSISRWREPKLDRDKKPGVLTASANPPVRLMNPLMPRKFMPDKGRHCFFESDLSFEDYVLVNLGSNQLDKDTLVDAMLKYLRENAADVDALAIAACTLMHFERFDGAANLAFRAWRYQPNDLYLQVLLARAARAAIRGDLVEDLRAWEMQSSTFVPQSAALVGAVPNKAGLFARGSPRLKAHRQLRREFAELYRRINRLLRSNPDL